ncbi:MAG: NUMOD3 domain-containing DNA-binding protein, partial [Sarcina sp.]
MESKEFYVYFYRRKDTNDVCYIGKGTGKRAYKYSAHNSYCKRIYLKHGLNVEIVKDNLTELESLNMEIELIRHYVFDLGYGICINGYNNNKDGHNLCNMTLGGEGMSGVIPNEETRKKISDSKLGDKNPAKREDVKIKLSKNQRMKNKQNAKIQSEKMKDFFSKEENKEKWSKNKIDFYNTEQGIETKLKISKIQKEYLKTEEGKEQLRKAGEAAKEFWNSEKSEEAKEKISNSLKEFWSSEEGKLKREEMNEKVSGFNNSNSINIKCLETEEIFPNIVELSKIANIPYERIRGRFR